MDIAKSAKGFKEHFHCIQSEEAASYTDNLTYLRPSEWKKDSKHLTRRLTERLRAIEKSKPRDEIRYQSARPINGKSPRFKASVVLPTHNAGPIIQAVLKSLHLQNTPWKFQCVLIDSSSKDGTLDQLQAFAKNHKNVSIHQIDQDNFQHGHTRNQGVAWSDAEFVAFLT